MTFVHRPADEVALPLLEAFRVDYGPPELLTRFMLAADDHCRTVGLTLEYGRFTDLLAANEANRASWFPLIGMFDPRNGMLTPETAFCVLARNGAGEIVASHACRLYDWTGTTLADEAASLRIYYPDAERMKRPGEALIVKTNRNHLITGRVAFSGAAWIRPDQRGKGLSAILPKIAKVTAFTRFSPDLICGLMTENVHKSGFAPRFDYPNVDFEVQMINNHMGTFRMAVVWMEGGDILASAQQWLARSTAPLQAIERARRA
jgi:hypothetical protein